MNKLFKFLIVSLAFVSSMVWAQSKPTPLRIVTEDFPPFQTLHNGEIVGPMYSVMRAICKEAQIECSIELLAWKDAYKQSVDGDADVVFSILLEVPERRELFHLSPSIVNTSYSFFVTSRNNWRYTGLKSLDGMMLGAYGPSGTSIVAQEVVAGRIKAGLAATPLTIEPSIVESFQQLVIGKYGSSGAVVVNKDVGLSLLKQHSIVGPKVAGDIKQITYGFGFSKKSKRQGDFDKMVRALAVLKKRGEILDTLRIYGLKASE
ncbi:Solute-binding protein family 3/N-terminal domain of MltF [uncultured Caudovirales phage]|uniref:Solute-binding protein family 3/N-terminal domain of MltF n=1 Tax=uncultured Caudovirales phage TaxID=2100421 RepID=A0A6J5LEL9_9CAUD|nr:Solute-binding protein family 3/N-terminal domain of MltF [uncultured Caudovirales phage]